MRRMPGTQLPFRTDNQERRQRREKRPEKGAMRGVSEERARSTEHRQKIKEGGRVGGEPRNHVKKRETEGKVVAGKGRRHEGTVAG